MNKKSLLQEKKKLLELKKFLLEKKLSLISEVENEFPQLNLFLKIYKEISFDNGKGIEVLQDAIGHFNSEGLDEGNDFYYLIKMKPVLRWLESRLQSLNIEDLKKEINHFCSELDSIDGDAVRNRDNK